MRMALALLMALCASRVVAADYTPSRLDRLEIDVVRAEDLSAIRKVQRAYGYYADRGLWDDLADLFADDAVANYPSGGFDGKPSIRAMFVENLGQGSQGLAEGRIYNHTILQPVVDLAPDGSTATGRWRVLGMLGRFGGTATWADSLYRFDYVKRDGRWKIRALTAYAGSGGSYEQGWVAPAPRPPGYVDRSPVRFNLAHPADRPWVDPCEADVSTCVVPFPYPSRGTTKPAVKVSAVLGTENYPTPAARAADLVRRAHRREDEQAVMNLQHAYGYYLDRGLWDDLANLFAPDGTREVGQGGVYVGRKRIRESMELTGPAGLREGQLNEHLQFETIVDVAPDGRTASGRVFELGFVGGGGIPGRILQNVHVNQYVKRDGVWMIQSLQHYTILLTDYAQGWAKSALPARGVSQTLPPDRPPSVLYETYPKVYTPPLHFTNPSMTAPARPAVAQDVPMPGDREIAAAEARVRRVLAYDEIENLQSAYGYYAEKSLWPEVAKLFTKNGVLVIDGTQHAGRNRILAALKASGPEGPVKGALDSQLQTQPVIHVSDDGRSAKMRSRLLEFTRDRQGKPMWAGGIYETELVREDGVWKFRRMRLTTAWKVDYKRGWARPAGSAAGEGEVLPSRFTPPFHYNNPVSRPEPVQ